MEDSFWMVISICLIVATAAIVASEIHIDKDFENSARAIKPVIECDLLEKHSHYEKDERWESLTLDCGSKILEVKVKAE